MRGVEKEHQKPVLQAGPALDLLHPGFGVRDRTVWMKLFLFRARMGGGGIVGLRAKKAGAGKYETSCANEPKRSQDLTNKQKQTKKRSFQN